MRGNDEVEDQALERLRNLADETAEQAHHVLKEASQAAGEATQALSTRSALVSKRR